MKYICVEGCLGIGKTTVTTQLANTINGSHVLLEDFASHPFLDDFYADPRFTFETELNFLLIHFHQLYKTMGKNLHLLVSDYFFDKDKMFADANILSEMEMGIFMKLYHYLRSRLISPNVVICLSGSTDMIFQRILDRNRDSERSISYEYVDKINRHYELFFSEIRENYVTIDIDMNTNDFIKNPALITSVSEHLQFQVLRNITTEICT